MQIDKQEVINLLREKGRHDKVDQAQQQLPDKVDHEQHSDLLQKLGINPQELLSKL
jgi:DNA-binding protein H-NS